MSANTWLEKEIEILKKYYESQGPSYCSKLIGRTNRSCKEKAKKLGIKYDRSFKYKKEKISLIVKESKSYTECIKKLGLSPKSASNFDTLKRYIKLYDLDISHFSTSTEGLKNHVSFITISLEDILVKDSTYANRTKLKEKLYKEGLKKRECEKCGQGEEWKGNNISLIIDHINGVSDDNRIENLRILCPNCNAALETHCSKNKNRKIYDREKDKYFSLYTHKKCICGKIILKESNFCVECNGKNERKNDRPTLKQLEQDVKELGYCGTGRKYNVSDNCIRKWIKYYKSELAN